MHISRQARSLLSSTRHFLSRKAPPLLHSRLLLSPPLHHQLLALPVSMATESTFSSANGEDDAKFGFTRPEMYKSDLARTVDGYDRHVFLCYKSPDSWASRVEDSDIDPLPKLLSSAVKARRDDITLNTKLTICGGGDGPEFSDGDVLIFPDMVKYRGLKDMDVDGFVDDVLVKGKPWALGEQEVLTGSHVFVCAHGSRDKRCGVCGPVLMEKLNEEIALRALKDQVFVNPCSHIGGHKYAGNLIIYGPHSEGKIAGHWYGYVTPEDVPEILDQHIGKGEVIERLLRGQMGVYEKGNKEKLPNGKKEKKKNNKHHESPQVKEDVSKNTFSGCCQGENGVSCCKDRSVEQNGDSESKKLKEPVEEDGTKGLGRLLCWTKNWEQTDVLMAVGVVGAVATVAVAYSFYRRSG